MKAMLPNKWERTQDVTVDGMQSFIFVAVCTNHNSDIFCSGSKIHSGFFMMMSPTCSLWYSLFMIEHLGTIL